MRISPDSNPIGWLILFYVSFSGNKQGDGLISEEFGMKTLSLFNFRINSSLVWLATGACE